MKKALFVIVCSFGFILSSCTEVTEEPGLEKNPDQQDDTNTCDIGYNEAFETCVDPLISPENFHSLSVSIDDEYNLSQGRMITNVMYNYIAEVFEFEVYYVWDMNISGVQLAITDKNTEIDIVDEYLFRYRTPSYTAPADGETFYQKIRLEGVPSGTIYQIMLTYDYNDGFTIDSDRVMAGFTVDTRMFDSRNAPVLADFTVVSTTTESIELAFKVIYYFTEVDALEVRVYDSETGEYTGISKPITDLDSYREQVLINIPSLVIDGLSSETSYDFRIYGSGSNDVDDYTNVLLFSEETMNHHETD